MPAVVTAEQIRIETGGVAVDADLHLPAHPAGLVIFAHGSGSSRFSSRNRAVARVLEQTGFGTLLLDLLTREEDVRDARTAEHRFNVDLLGGRMIAAVDWVGSRGDLRDLPVALFGASTGAAAALIAAAARPAVAAVISRGGRPDLAGADLRNVHAPTLLIVGGYDAPVIETNRDAMRHIRVPVTLEIVPGASHLFEEGGALEQVASLAAAWCRRHLVRATG